jgi:hypothetical protein
VAHKVIVGKINDSPKDFVRSAKTGAETLTASVGAGEIAIVIDTGVNLGNSMKLEETVRDMMQFFRENEFVET